MESATTLARATDEPIRIALAVSERVTRAGLRMLIDSQPGLRVTVEFEHPGPSRAAWALEPTPQIALVDLDGHASLDLIRAIQDAGVDGIRIIVLTSAPDSAACASAVEHGALGVVSKQHAPEVLIRAIEKVHAGEVWLERTKLASALGNMLGAVNAVRRQREITTNATLAKRERQLITLVAQGFRNSEIAASLFVSEATIRNGLASIFRKLGISSRVHLMIYAFREGFVNLPASGGPPTPSSPRDLLRLATSAGRPPASRPGVLGPERQLSVRTKS